MFTKNQGKAKEKGGLVPKAPPRAKKKSAAGKQLISFDIGSKTTKMVVGKYKGNSITIDTMSGTVNQKNSVFDGKLMEPISMQGTIRKLIMNNNVKVKDTVFTLESSTFLRREMDIPNVDKAEDIKGVASHEISKYLPVDINAYVLQVKDIGTFDDGTGHKKKKLAAGAIPRSIAESYVSFCDSVMLERYAMDMNSNSLEKLLLLEMQVNPNCEFKNRSVAFIDMGHSFFNISIYSNGRYTFNKILEIGGSTIDSSISASLRITTEDAEVVKLKNSNRYAISDLLHRLSQPDAGNNMETKVLRDTLNTYNSWATDIGQVLKYYTTRNRSNTIDHVYLFGGCSFVNGMERFMQDRLQIPTSSYVDFRCVNLLNQQTNKNILNYLNAIGALIRY